MPVPRPVSHVDIVDLSLDVGYRVYVAHDWYLKDHQPIMDNDNKHESVVRVQAPLIEKRRRV